MKKAENQKMEKEYKLFCERTKKRILLGKFLFFTSLVLIFVSMLTSNF